MAQVRSVLSRRQLVEIPGRLSIHLLHYLHPVPGTYPAEDIQAPAEGIHFTNSMLPPEALSYFGMLLRGETGLILFFGAQDKFDFNRASVHGALPGHLQASADFFSYFKGIFLELFPVKKSRSNESRKLFTKGKNICEEKQSDNC